MNPKTGARKLLEKEDVNELLKQYTYYEIAENFGTSPNTVYRVARKQFAKYDISNAFDRSQKKELNKRTKEDDLNCGNAWGILKGSGIYKQVINKNKNDE